MIIDIECFPTELDGLAFPDFEVANHTGVYLKEIRILYAATRWRTCRLAGVENPLN